MSAARRKGAIAGTLGLALSALCLWLTFRRVALAEVADALRPVPLWAPLLALGFKLAGVACLAARARALLAPLARVRLALSARAVLVGFVGNNVLPARLGEVARAGYLARHAGLPLESCLAVVVIERLLDLALLFALFLALALGLATRLPWSGATLAVGALAAAALAALAGFAHRPGAAVRAAAHISAPLSRVLRRFAAGLEGLSLGAPTLHAAASSVGYWMATLASIHVFITALGLDLPWYAPGVVLVFLAFGTALPAAPGFVGTFHYFATSALVLLGVDAPRAAAFALVLHAVAIVPLTLIGVGALLPEWLGWRRRESLEAR